MGKGIRKIELVLQKSAELGRLGQDRGRKPMQLESHGGRGQEEQITMEQDLS